MNTAHSIRPPMRYRAMPHRQQGVILFIALIAMVIMTLAALGFMRSVDTGKILAGNQAFNRASIAISDGGMEAARAVIANLDNNTVTSACGLTDAGASCLWLDGTALPITVTGSIPLMQCAGVPCTNGYFATAEPAFNYRTTDWSNAYSLQTTGMTGAQTDALIGYEVRYIIHRMCEKPGDPSKAHCLTQSVLGGESKGSVDSSNSQPKDTAVNPVYRITVRVAGPRNSLSYIQIWMS